MKMSQLSGGSGTTLLLGGGLEGESREARSGPEVERRVVDDHRLTHPA